MFVSALIFGFIGSVHCLTMCGPLSMLFSFQGKTVKGVMNALLYQAGRISIYVALGALVGSLMKGSDWLGISQQLSIGLGGLFVLLGITYVFLKPAGLERSGIGTRITKLYGSVVSKSKLGAFKYLFAGVLNGVLPCGLVYGALSGTVLTGNTQEGALYMLMFGLGTLPAMLVSSFASNYIRRTFSFFKLKYVMTCFLLFSGGLLLLRGLNLGIPYVSPDFMNHQKASYCEVN